MLPFIYIVSLCTLILFRRDIQTVDIRQLNSLDLFDDFVVS